MDKAIELPIAECDLKVTVGRDGVWLQLGKYASFHVHNTLGQGSGIIPSNVNKWCVEREIQAGIKKDETNALPR